MHSPMAKNLLTAGFELALYNRTAAASPRLAAEVSHQRSVCPATGCVVGTAWCAAKNRAFIGARCTVAGATAGDQPGNESEYGAHGPGKYHQRGKALCLIFVEAKRS